MNFPKIDFVYPDWLGEAVDWERSFSTDEEKIRVAIELSRLNVENKTGGPFGAAIFDRMHGRIVAVGVNLVVLNNNSAMHAEMVAIMMGQARIGSYTLQHDGGPGYDLAASSEPCAMCLGGTLWSGISRLICGATGDDAREIGFDEGPVFPESYAYLEKRGISIAREVLRPEAKAVLDLYRSRGGPIYNG